MTRDSANAERLEALEGCCDADLSVAMAVSRVQFEKYLGTLRSQPQQRLRGPCRLATTLHPVLKRACRDAQQAR
jgi:hypothetical protein